jgi:hypothetical protein
MTRRLLWLVVGGALFWLALAYPARRLWGDPALPPWWDPVLQHSLVALGLCLAPGLVTVLWGTWAARWAPEAQLLAVLGSTALRMVFVLAGGLVVFFRVPGFREPGFWGWVLAFYLFTLALEMALLLKGRPAPGSP